MLPGCARELLLLWPRVAAWSSKGWAALVVAQQALQDDGGRVGAVAVDGDGIELLEPLQIGMDGIAMEPHPPGVVAGGIAQLVGTGGAPLDVAVEGGDPQGDVGADAEAALDAAQQSTGEVGHRAHRRRAAGGVVEAGGVGGRRRGEGTLHRGESQCGRLPTTAGVPAASGEWAGGDEPSRPESPLTLSRPPPWPGALPLS